MLTCLLQCGEVIIVFIVSQWPSPAVIVSARSCTWPARAVCQLSVCLSVCFCICTGRARKSLPRGSCLASRQFFACLGLSFASAARYINLEPSASAFTQPLFWLGLGSVSKFPPGSCFCLNLWVGWTCPRPYSMMGYDTKRNGCFDWHQYSMTVGFVDDVNVWGRRIKSLSTWNHKDYISWFKEFGRKS